MQPSRGYAVIAKQHPLMTRKNNINIKYEDIWDAANKLKHYSTANILMRKA
jgi:hypothetical protein